MIEAFTALIYGFAIGIAGGAASSFLGWIKEDTPFIGKKFVLGIATGIIAGIVAVLANTAALTQAADETTLLITLATIFVGIIGVDTVRTAISGAITQRAAKSKVENK